MAEYFLCRINGRPKGKGRPRFNKSGRAYTPKATREYEKAVREAAMKAAAALQWLKPAKEVPLEVSVMGHFATQFPAVRLQTSRVVSPSAAKAVNYVEYPV